MAVASTSNSSSLQTNLNPQICLCRPTLPSQHLLRQIHGYAQRLNRSRATSSYRLSIRAFMENSNCLSGFANKVVGSLPIFGLIARILSDEGGVGGDIIDFGDPLYVLFCCWLAAVGAGLLKSEEILEGVARLSISNDIEFQEENFLSLMNEAREKRAKRKVWAPTIQSGGSDIYLLFGKRWYRRRR